MNDHDQLADTNDSDRPPDDPELIQNREQHDSESTEDPSVGPDVSDADVDANDLAARVMDLGASIGPKLFDQIADVDLGDMRDLISDTDTPLGNSSMGDNTNEQIEEIADDMLNLMRRVSSIEDGLQTVIANLQQVQESSAQMGRTIAREIDTLRRDVVGDRKHTAATSLFNELIPMIDRLRTMRAHLDMDQDSRMSSQLDGVLETLAASLQRLGCDEFNVATGDAFDPIRMQCDAYEQDNEPAVVLGTVRPGYLFGDYLMRPATVTVGAAALEENDDMGED